MVIFIKSATLLYIIILYLQPVNWSVVPTYTSESYGSYKLNLTRLNYTHPTKEAEGSSPVDRVSNSWVQVMLVDSNDNHPHLVVAHEFITLQENASVNTLLGKFHATDSDSVSL